MNGPSVRLSCLFTPRFTKFGLSRKQHLSVRGSFLSTPLAGQPEIQRQMTSVSIAKRRAHFVWWVRKAGFLGNGPWFCSLCVSAVLYGIQKRVRKKGIQNNCEDRISFIMECDNDIPTKRFPSVFFRVFFSQDPKTNIGGLESHRPPL